MQKFSSYGAKAQLLPGHIGRSCLESWSRNPSDDGTWPAMLSQIQALHPKTTGTKRGGGSIAQGFEYAKARHL